MPERFAPNLDILPESQKSLWGALDATPRDFVLYGGTALALRPEELGALPVSVGVKEAAA